MTAWEPSERTLLCFERTSTWPWLRQDSTADWHRLGGACVVDADHGAWEPDTYDTGRNPDCGCSHFRGDYLADCQDDWVAVRRSAHIVRRDDDAPAESPWWQWDWDLDQHPSALVRALHDFSEDSTAASWETGLGMDAWRLAASGGGRRYMATMSRTGAHDLLRLAFEGGVWWEWDAASRRVAPVEVSVWCVLDALDRALWFFREGCDG